MGYCGVGDGAPERSVPAGAAMLTKMQYLWYEMTAD
jgi:hypothetical protein